MSDPRPLRARGFVERAAPPQDLAVVGTSLYISDGEVVQAWDLTDPLSPVATGRCAIPLCGRLTAVAPALLFVAADCEGMFVIDLTNPARPVRLGRFGGPGDVTKIAVRDRHAFVADYTGGVTVVDVTNPRKPRAVAEWDEGIVGDVAVAGARVFLAMGELVALDVSDPVRPRACSRSSPQRLGDTAWGVIAHDPHVFALGEAALTVWRAT